MYNSITPLTRIQHTNTSNESKSEYNDIDQSNSSTNMVDQCFFNANKWIHTIISGLNLSRANAIKSGIYIDEFKPYIYDKNKKELYEIFIYKFNEPYHKCKIDFPLYLIFDNQNRNQISKFLIQFLQINHYNNKLIPNKTKENALKTLLNNIVKRAKEIFPYFSLEETESKMLIKLALTKYYESVNTVDHNNVQELLSNLELLKEKKIWSIIPYAGRDFANKERGKAQKEHTNQEILSCIKLMKAHKMFICSDTIKEQLDKGENQIKRVVKDNKDDINNYNKKEFGVISYRWYKDKYEKKLT